MSETRPGAGEATLLRFPRISRLAVAAAVAIGVCALVLALSTGDVGQDIATLRILATDNPVSSEELELNHFRLRLFAILTAGLGGASSALWLAWQYAAHANLKALGVPRLRFSPLTGVLAWLLPGPNLLLPPLAMREIWRASDPHPRDGDWRKAPTTPLLWLWWLVFVGAIFLGARAILPAAEAGATFDELILRDNRLITACWVGVLAGVLAILLIVQTCSRQVLKEDVLRPRDWRRWPT